MGENFEEYDVIASLIAILFHPSLQLNVYHARQTEKVVQKIEQSKNNVILEESEYNIVKSAFEKVTGFTRHDMILIERIMEAKIIEVKEKNREDDNNE